MQGLERRLSNLEKIGKINATMEMMRLEERVAAFDRKVEDKVKNNDPLLYFVPSESLLEKDGRVASAALSSWGSATIAHGLHSCVRQ